MQTETAERKPRRLSWRHALGVGVGIAVVVATFAFVLPKIADYRDVWGVVKGLSWEDIALLAGATILNLLTFAPPWMAALPGLGSGVEAAEPRKAPLRSALERRSQSAHWPSHS